MSKSDDAKAREHRLAAKLRENLRRRKAAPAGREARDDRGDAEEEGRPSGTRRDDRN